MSPVKLIPLRGGGGGEGLLPFLFTLLHQAPGSDTSLPGDFWQCQGTFWGLTGNRG